MGNIYNSGNNKKKRTKEKSIVCSLAIIHNSGMSLTCK